MNEEQEVRLRLRIDQTELDEVIRKIEHIRDLINEANSLAGELASHEKTIAISVECQD